MGRWTDDDALRRAQPKLAPGWEEVAIPARDRRPGEPPRYFWNRETDEVAWERPAAAEDPERDAALARGRGKRPEILFLSETRASRKWVGLNARLQDGSADFRADLEAQAAEQERKWHEWQRLERPAPAPRAPKAKPKAKPA